MSTKARLRHRRYAQLSLCGQFPRRDDRRAKGDPAAPGLTGSFSDPSIPAGFAPFNIQKIGNSLFVTYALQDAAKHDDVAGLGNGFVDEFDLNGNLIRRFATQGTLNSPWGVTLAPASFDALGGDLLIGNFGDGRINVFDPTAAFSASCTARAAARS